MAKKHVLYICVQLLITTTFIQLVITQRLLLSGLIPKRSTCYMSHITNRNFTKLWSVFLSSYSMKKSEAFFFWGTASKVFTTHSNIYDEAFRHHRCLTGFLISLWIAMLNKSWETQDLHHQRCMENTINYPRWSFSWTYLIDEGRQLYSQKNSITYVLYKYPITFLQALQKTVKENLEPSFLTVNLFLEWVGMFAIKFRSPEFRL